MVMDRATSGYVVAETMKTTRRVNELQEKAETLAGMGRRKGSGRSWVR